MSVSPINTMNNPTNFSPQQSDAHSEVSRRPRHTPQPAGTAKEFETAEIANATLKAQAAEQASPSYFNQAKELIAEIEQEYRQWSRPIIAVKQPFWFVKSLRNAYQKYKGTSPVDPFLEKRQYLQEAIEKATTDKAFEVLAKNRHLLNEPLPNGHLPLNYTIFKGNLVAMQVLLNWNCNPEQRDFQSQTALDIAHITGNEKIQETLKEFLIVQQKIKLIESLKDKKPGEINQDKLKEILQGMEKHVEKYLAERTIADPLALSMNDKMACVFAILWLGGQAFSDFGVMKNHYVATYLLPGFAVASQISEMRHVWENAGHLPTMVSAAASMCGMIPSLQFIYKPFKTGMMSLSMLNTLKATADNYRLRGWDSVTKLAVNSMNFYHFWTYTPPAEGPVKDKEFCKNLKNDLRNLHIDRLKQTSSWKDTPSEIQAVLEQASRKMGEISNDLCKATPEHVGEDVIHL